MNGPGRTIPTTPREGPATVSPAPSARHREVSEARIPRGHRSTPYEASATAAGVQLGRKTCSALTFEPDQFGPFSPLHTLGRFPAGAHHPIPHVPIEGAMQLVQVDARAGILEQRWRPISGVSAESGGDIDPLACAGVLDAKIVVRREYSRRP